MKNHVPDLETCKKLAPHLPEGFESKFVWSYAGHINLKKEEIFSR